MKRSKKYLAAAEKIDRNKKYSLDEAVILLPEINAAAFAGTVELSILLKLSDKQKKETIRGSYTLPHSLGKEVNVLLFAGKGYKADKSKADTVGGEELIKKVEDGKVDFDVVIATPDMMPKIAKLGKTLGTKGLMPNPKNGTVTDDPDKAIAKFKAGTKNYKMDDAGRLNAAVAKIDMKSEQISENIKQFFKAVGGDIRKLGTGVIKRVTLSPSIGPSIQLDTADLI
ncbi:MAG: 50S ribosomal protein L1 [Candidatus Dojkabacteria bacterium]